ncbi:MAG TPA: proline--tRNA ligase [Candidatus Limnocylindria bacterium]|nr:proline--tRNA ligase [Candidatus Limnocylindria bacterium]
MRQSTLFGRTLREAPAEAQTVSHQLVLRAALARPLATGLYTLLPLGYRVARKIEQIVRDEIDRIGGQEMKIPIIIPAEYMQETGRWDALEPNAFRTKDHSGRDYMIPYTHEELFTHHARNEVVSYRQLPLIAYHFQAKGRDEERSRGGLLRVREFVMKDSYSYDLDAAGMEKAYRAHFEAYVRIYRRLGIRAHAVESDTGAMGGDVAHEFQVLTDEGEDTLVFCTTCDYKANLERATRRLPEPAPAVGVPAREQIETPGLTTIEQLQRSLGLPASAFLKTLLLRTSDGKVIAVVLPGDRELNHAKLRKRLGGRAFAFASDADFAASRTVPGFVGPIVPSGGLIVDASVEPRGYVAGANVKDRHVKNLLPGRDLPSFERLDVHDVHDGDACPSCGGRLAAHRGVEVGNIFKFGTYYSDKMHATYLAEDGTRKPMYMCSYGIGIGRNLQTIIIENHDDKGIVWPISVAPFEVHVIALPMNDDAVRAAAEGLVADLESRGIEVLYDDRNDSAGVKFADADLIGIPFRVAVSRRSLGSASVELKARAATELELVPKDVAAERIVGIVHRAREAARFS